ncbi:hypothetical protein L6452_14937 [Arctium lappa]|uniref:Uncharacterized protein n=1 Tax=Arctium lappa TaxID=4217 RepID=A0ACB9CML8_ARCLA|nr:hypothetical protein L6452_14937 [Arctium lappa]
MEDDIRGVETLMKDLSMDEKQANNTEGSSVRGCPIDKQTKSETPEEVEKKRKPIIGESSNSDRKRTKLDTRNMQLDIHTRRITIIVESVYVLLDCNSMGSCNLGFISKLKNEAMEYMGFMDLKMKQLMNAKTEAKQWLETTISVFNGDPSFDKYKIDMENLFKTGRWSTSGKHTEATTEDKKKSDSMAIVVVEQVDPLEPFDACWDCPSFMAAVRESVEMEVKKSEIKKSLSEQRNQDFGIDPPGFDLRKSLKNIGDASKCNTPNESAPTSAMKACNSQGSKDRGKKIVTFSPIPMTSYFDDSDDEH